MSLTELKHLCWLINCINRAPNPISQKTAERSLEFQFPVKFENTASKPNAVRILRVYPEHPVGSGY